MTTNKSREEYNAYMRTYMLRRYHKQRQNIIALLGGKCTNCDSTENLEVNHIDPTQKSFTVSMSWSIKPERTLEEIKKCQLLCKTCHINKHKSNHPCGTPHKYWRGCRCALCRKANADHGREYKRTWRKKRRCS